MIDPRAALALWEIAPPISVERMGGTNNLSWRIDAPGGSYILRLYQNVGNVPHVAFEHAVLTRLMDMDLSFQVPAPVPTKENLTLQSSTDHDGATVHLALFVVIPGQRPNWGNIEGTRRVGTALGELDQALAAVNVPADLVSVGMHGQLDIVHPLVPDPVEAIRTLDAEERLRATYASLIERAAAASGRLYATLPSQIVHSDIARSNTLAEYGRVSGILDFEFCGPDLRIFDLAVGVLMFAADWSAGGFRFDLPLVQALAGGYNERVRLTAAEIMGMPDILRLRSATSVIHRLGRYRAGLASLDDVTSRMREGIRMDAWLQKHGDALLEAIAPPRT